MSEYEEQRLKNIADNKEHLASLGLDTAGFKAAEAKTTKGRAKVVYSFGK